MSDMEKDLCSSARFEAARSLAAFSCIGRRPDQQDCYAIGPDSDKGQLLLVADGMGGLNHGGEISSLLLNAILESFEVRPAEENAAAFLMELLGDANTKVNAFLQNKDNGGSTLLAALIRGREMNWISVGDSRIYLCRGGGLIRLTREHNLKRKLHMLLLNGLMTPESIENSHQKRALTSYIGMGELAEVDMNLTSLTLLSGDTVLLMTDGVFGTLSEAEIAEAMNTDVENAARQLQTKVMENQREVQDNFTAVIYRVE